MRLKQLHAAEPDTKGLDVLTGKASLFRLATFRERLGVDYLPTAEAVSELRRMLQAEVEHLMHSTDDSPVKEEVPGRGEESKKQRLQRLQASLNASKAKATPPGGPKLPGSGAKPCRSWLTPGGCTYGSSCQFFHDQDEEKMRGRCFCCSAEDHWADSCPVKARLKAEAKAAPTLLQREKEREKAKEGKGKEGKQGAKPKVCVTDPQPASSGAAPDPIDRSVKRGGWHCSHQCRDPKCAAVNVDQDSSPQCGEWPDRASCKRRPCHW